MSARAVRDYMRSVGGDSTNAPTPDDTNIEDDGANPRRQNLFDMLGDDDNDECHSEEDNDDDDSSAGFDKDDEDDGIETTGNTQQKPRETARERRDRERAKKAALKEARLEARRHKQDQQDSTTAPPASPHADTTEAASLPSQAALFAVQNRFFDPEADMRALFGARALAESGLARSSGRWPPNSVVRGRPEWAATSVGTGLGMRHLGSQRFAFEWGTRYEASQAAYDAAVRSMDAGELGEVLRIAPWHADTLYQMALVRLQTGDADSAEDLLVRCLYVHQRAFHHMFSTRGDCRLRYGDHPQNRTFLLALFRYAAVLSARGCARAALETCKFLFTLDPSDPLGALLILDHYAVRARQYDILDAMAALPSLSVEESGDGNEKDGDKDGGRAVLAPRQLPNMRYNMALARFRQEGAESDHRVSGAMLERALEIFPLAARLLLSDDTKNERAQMLLSTRLFGEKAVEETPEALAHIVSIFVARNSELWNEPDAHAWLLDHCEAAAARHDSADSHDSDDVNAEREELYRLCLATDVLGGVYRHLLVSDFSTSVAQIPREILLDAVGDGGGFRAFDAGERPVVPAPTNNIFRLLLYTFLPWVDVPNAPARDPNQ